MSESSKEADRFKSLHKDFARHHLRGLWQRETSGVPPLQAYLWAWKEISPILEQALKTVRLPEDIDQRVIGLNAPGKFPIPSRPFSSSKRFCRKSASDMETAR